MKRQKPQIILKRRRKIADHDHGIRFDTVGPSIGKEVATRAAGAVGLAAIAIMIYITFAFRGVPTLTGLELRPLSPCFTTSWLLSVWKPFSAISWVGKLIPYS